MSSWEATKEISFWLLFTWFHEHYISMCAKKVVSDSLGLVDFAIPGNFVLNLPDGQVKFLRNLNYRKTVKSIRVIKMFLGLVEMTLTLWLQGRIEDFF